MDFRQFAKWKTADSPNEIFKTLKYKQITSAPFYQGTDVIFQSHYFE